MWFKGIDLLSGGKTFIASFSLYWILTSYPLLACEISPARDIVNSLINLDTQEASEKINQLVGSDPHQLDIVLYQAMVELVRSFNVDDPQIQQIYERKALNALTLLVNKIKPGLFENENQMRAETMMTLGFALAMKAGLHYGFDENFKAYSAGRDGRKMLRRLIDEQPDKEDAYLALGMYEYYLGRAKEDGSIAGRLASLAGDTGMGIAYLERAVENAPVVAPEAARVLLIDVKMSATEKCRYRSLVQQMHLAYPRNIHLELLAQIIPLECRIAETEGQVIAEDGGFYLNQGCAY